MFFDNLIIFLNVLEQFAIRVTSIFETEDFIKYVNKLYFNNNDELFRIFLEENKDKKWAAPFYGCVKCMSSVWSAIFFFPNSYIFIWV